MSDSYKVIVDLIVRMLHIDPVMRVSVDDMFDYLGLIEIDNIENDLSLEVSSESDRLVI